jgi:hypothetical protein
LQIVVIVKIDATNVVGGTNARTEGIVVRKKVVSGKTSATVNRKRSAMA